MLMPLAFNSFIHFVCHPLEGDAISRVGDKGSWKKFCPRKSLKVGQNRFSSPTSRLSATGFVHQRIAIADS
jgi:hypothetical protein